MWHRAHPVPWLLGFLAGLAACRSAPREAPSGIAPSNVVDREWSKVVQGVRGRLIATPVKRADGARQLRIDVELENVSDLASPLHIWWSDIESVVDFTLEDEAGSVVPRMSPGGNHMSPLPHWFSLEGQSLVRFTVTRNAYEYVPGVRTLLRPVSFQAWEPPATGKLYLRATLDAKGAEDVSMRPIWRGPLALPRVLLPP